MEHDLDTLNQFLAENVAAAKKHAIDLFSIKYQKSALFDSLFNIVEDCVLIDTKRINKKEKSSLGQNLANVFCNEMSKRLDSAQVVKVKSFPFSASASKQVDVEMTDTRAQNNAEISEFKTPTNISPEKLDGLETEIKSALP